MKWWSDPAAGVLPLSRSQLSSATPAHRPSHRSPPDRPEGQGISSLRMVRPFVNVSGSICMDKSGFTLFSPTRRDTVPVNNSLFLQFILAWMKLMYFCAIQEVKKIYIYVTKTVKHVRNIKFNIKIVTRVNNQQRSPGRFLIFAANVR